MRRKGTLLLKWLLVILGVFPATAAPPQSADTNVLWRIGAFDRSSGEFAGGAPEHPVTFLAGKSNSSGWYATQPVEFISTAGPLNASTLTSSRAIQFEMAG